MLTAYRNHALSHGLGRGTVDLYTDRLSAFTRATGLELTAVTLPDLERFLADRRDRLAAETRKTFRSAFRSFYSWAEDAGRIAVNPAAKLRPVRVPLTVPRVAPDDVVQLGLISAPPDETLMILLARFACLRLNELTTLHTRHREGDTLRITGKGEKQRLVPINEQLAHALDDVERDQGRGYYFPGRYGGALHPTTVYKKIHTRTGYNPHALRHAGATAAYLATNDLRAVQLFLGHSSMATTQRYLHIGMDAIRAVAAGTAFTSNVTSPHFPQWNSAPHSIAA